MPLDDVDVDGGARGDESQPELFADGGHERRKVGERIAHRWSTAGDLAPFASRSRTCR